MEDTQDYNTLPHDCCAHSNGKMIFGASYTNQLNSDLGTATIDDLMIFDRPLDSSDFNSIYQKASE